MPLRLDLRRRTSPADTLRRAAAAEADAVTQIQIELCEIAAPVDAEALRGQAVARWLRSSGYEVQHDAIGNVIARRPGRSAGPAVALSAHLDSVFPAHQPVRVARPGEPDPYRATQSDGDTRVPAGELRAPGIADDAAGLAAMIAFARAFALADPATERDLLFVATVGEEGRGDLKGARHFFAQPPGRELHAFITLDHPQANVIVHRGVASRRYLVEFNGPGGHSWGHAGRYNPALTLADAARRIGAIATPEQPRTTCNIGVMAAGQSVNAIPERASMQIDLRSEDPRALDTLDIAVQQAIRDAQDASAANLPEAGSSLQRIGERPGGATPADSPLVSAARKALAAEGFSPKLAAASTDANAAMAAGVPAICLGWGGRSGDQHSLREWFAPEGRERTLAVVARLVGGLAGLHDSP
ncbi:MAG: Acetylornithine deacetylase/Succinyl-diaminopimelate desuccinylase [Chloroflexi bacterium]|nr:MAG: Acetylornithine deacetylase/Succinyl-diaminopimelate desuccinylase [Chloroflexota bacterium]